MAVGLRTRWVSVVCFVAAVGLLPACGEGAANSDVQRLAEALGFTLDRVAGSHHVYRHPDVTERLNLQPSRSGDAKPYQLRQLLQLAERHALNLPEEKP